MLPISIGQRDWNLTNVGCFEAAPLDYAFLWLTSIATAGDDWFYSLLLFTIVHTSTICHSQTLVFTLDVSMFCFMCREEVYFKRSLSPLRCLRNRMLLHCPLPIIVLLFMPVSCRPVLMPETATHEHVTNHEEFCQIQSCQWHLINIKITCRRALSFLYLLFSLAGLDELHYSLWAAIPIGSWW